jgi:hypothetical protein
MLTSKPVLDVLKAEKPAHTDKEAIQGIILTKRTPLKHQSSAIPKRKPLLPPALLHEVKQSGDSTGPLGKRAREEGCGWRSSRPEGIYEG